MVRCADAAQIGGANGCADWATHTLTVRADVDDAHAVNTLAHELAHVLLHNPSSDGWPDCHGIIEVEAESVAYLLTRHAGMTDVGDYSFAYIAGWSHASGHDKLP